MRTPGAADAVRAQCRLKKLASGLPKSTPFPRVEAAEVLCLAFWLTPAPGRASSPTSPRPSWFGLHAVCCTVVYPALYPIAASQARFFSFLCVLQDMTGSGLARTGVPASSFREQTPGTTARLQLTQR